MGFGFRNLGRSIPGAASAAVAGTPAQPAPTPIDKETTDNLIAKYNTLGQDTGGGRFGGLIRRVQSKAQREAIGAELGKRGGAYDYSKVPQNTGTGLQNGAADGRGFDFQNMKRR